jgi:hypothetical protein
LVGDLADPGVKSVIRRRSWFLRGNARRSLAGKRNADLVDTNMSSVSDRMLHSGSTVFALYADRIVAAAAIVTVSGTVAAALVWQLLSGDS